MTIKCGKIKDQKSTNSRPPLPAVWSITIASYGANLGVGPAVYMIGLFVTGTVIMRGAGCKINDLWDRNSSNKVERTKVRPLVWPRRRLAVAFLLLRHAGRHQLAVALPLYVSSVCWTLVYDTIYAHRNKKGDIKIGVKSTALRFGNMTSTYLAAFLTGIVPMLALLGYMKDQGWLFYAMSVGGAAAHLA
ncbi:hypothetical protein BGZ93_001146 [Podila epicladia]|nr:hypothetical protein BGZ92_003175 [Podila epicladia]KAG0084625.1 hypothetical protein BGZ93_001146 [Podila epicladia]